MKVIIFMPKKILYFYPFISERFHMAVQKKQKISKKFDNYEIVGIIDGICIEEKCILEIKTRNNLDMAKKTITKREQI